MLCAAQAARIKPEARTAGAAGDCLCIARRTAFRPAACGRWRAAGEGGDHDDGKSGGTARRNAQPDRRAVPNAADDRPVGRGPVCGGGPRAPRAVRHGCVYPRPDRIHKLLQKRLLLLRHPARQPQGRALPPDAGADPRLLRRGLRARLPHLCPAGRRGPVFYGRPPLRDRRGDPPQSPGLRDHAFSRRALARKLQAAV